MNAKKRVQGWGSWFRSNVTADTLKAWGGSLGLIAVLIRGESRQNTADKNVAEVVVASEQRSVANEVRSIRTDERLDSLIRVVRRVERKRAATGVVEVDSVVQQPKPSIIKRGWSWLTGWTRRV